jgi:(S)-ureidoglycine aminohydrolase
MLLAFLAVDVIAQSEPNRSPAENEPLESKVYEVLLHGSNAEVQVQPLAGGSTTHLESLSIEAITLTGKQSTVALDNAELDSEKLIIVKEGAVSISVGNHHKNVGPGSVALILPGEGCTIENTGDKPGIFYLLEYNSKSPVDLDRGREAGGSFIVDWSEIKYKEHSKGGRRDVFDRPTAMCEDFEMHVTNLNENTSSHDPHTHVVEEIILMVQGSISMHIDGNETEAGKGDFAFVDSNVPHAPTNIGSGQAIYFAFQWK